MKTHFTITGTNHYHGKEFIKPDMQVKLFKEPDNEIDKEAIRVEVEGLGKVGYVANSPFSVLGESYSAGRLYDKLVSNTILECPYYTGRSCMYSPKGCCAGRRRRSEQIKSIDMLPASYCMARNSL